MGFEIKCLINKKAKPAERKPLITACTRFGNTMRWNNPVDGFICNICVINAPMVKEHIYIYGINAPMVKLSSFSCSLKSLKKSQAP